MSNTNSIHSKEDLSQDYKNNGSQVKQNIPKKYTVLSEIKILQDRLQDMYTNRSDMVNATGDGWAAAHQNEVKEIFWVYLRSLGWVGGLHGAILGNLLGMLGFIYAGVFYELSFFYASFVLFALALTSVVYPFGYMIYAEMITEDSGKFVTGENTGQFFGEMRKAMAFVSSNTWMITIVMFFIMLFSVGIFEKKLIAFMVWILKDLFGLALSSQQLQQTIFSNGSIYGIILFTGTMVFIYIAKAIIIDNIKRQSSIISAGHIKVQKQFKHKDSVQEARELFQ